MEVLHARTPSVFESQVNNQERSMVDGGAEIVNKEKERAYFLFEIIFRYSQFDFFFVVLTLFLLIVVGL